MFTSRSVIILGAGASIDYGLPTGKQLWDQIVADCPHMATKYREAFRDAVVTNSDGYIRSLRDSEPKAFAYFTILRGEGNNLDERARELAQAVGDRNMHPNVDEFLRDNSSLKPVIQVLIAGNLFERLYHRKDDKWTLRERLFATTHESIRTAPAKEHWIRQCVGLCRGRLLETERFRRLTVVSFNYDRLMETLLREFWNRGENQYPKFDECIEFVYPYGAFSALEKIIQDPGRWILEQAKNLSPAGADNTRDTIIARTEMDRADQIFLLGFSCSDTNMRLLEFHARYGAKTFAQNYDNLDEHLERVLTTMGARSDKGSMLQLVRNGFFKQSGPAAADPRQTQAAITLRPRLTSTGSGNRKIAMSAFGQIRHIPARSRNSPL